MNTNFCEKWKGTGVSPDTKYCRECNSKPCKELWQIVKKLASKNNYNGTKAETKRGKPFRLYTTPKQSASICKFQALAKNRKGVSWNIPKEDFMYVLKTGFNDTPSHTRQLSHVEPIIKMILRSADGNKLAIQVKAI